MGDKSAIEWTEATWNPVTGCTKVSEGCRNCYAKFQAWPRLAASPSTVYYGRKFENVAWHPERFDQPLRWKKPRRIFVNSMSDLFHESIPTRVIDEIFRVMNLARRHIFQVLTKRPHRMQEYCALRDPLPNVWLGVSVEDQQTADSRVPLLLQTDAAVRWLSCEPLLGHIDLWHQFRWLSHIDWIVVGGESGKNARPMHPDWVRSLRDQCHRCSLAFFFKQWGEWTPERPSSFGRRASGMVAFDNEARHYNPRQPDDWLTMTTMYRAGKKKAGRMLDGRTWDEYPNMETSEWK